MKKKIFTGSLILAAIVTALMFSSCREKDRLDMIMESGRITFITRNNANCYYIYRDKPMGFEYDLAKKFADYLGVEMDVVVPSWNGMIDLLNSEEGDIIAASWTMTPSRMKKVNFSDPYMPITQQVILHKNNYRTRTIEGLRGRTIHLRSNTSYEKSIKDLNSQGFGIKIKYHDDIPTEELIRLVNEKKIGITIADSNIAMLNRRYYPEIKMAFSLGASQRLGWAIKRGEDRLRGRINEFFRIIMEDGTFDKIYNRYYAHMESFDYLDLKKFHKRIDTRLPRYEDMIKEAAQTHGFDWRMIAAMVYQESHFDPMAVSRTGVRGIMQLTSDAALDMGVEDLFDPEQNIMGGVRYLKILYDAFRDVPDPDRLYLALASYNVGKGHVTDAQNIARERQEDPGRWEVIKKILPLLQKSAYYKNTKYGYCRGSEPVLYVKNILIYYDILKKEAITLDMFNPIREYEISEG